MSFHSKMSTKGHTQKYCSSESIQETLSILEYSFNLNGWLGHILKLYWGYFSPSILGMVFEQLRHKCDTRETQRLLSLIFQSFLTSNKQYSLKHFATQRYCLVLWLTTMYLELADKRTGIKALCYIGCQIRFYNRYCCMIA